MTTLPWSGGGAGFERSLSWLSRLAPSQGAMTTYEGPPPATAAQAQAEPAAGEAQGDSYADTDPTALTDFHATLDPHGTWMDDPTYGTVWVPNTAEVGADFAPYETAGHWAYDNDDYVWMSDYDWGWGPFHYGRWVLTSNGWVWIPGRTYAGAWVDWQLGAPGWAYVGWAPMYPTFIWRGGVPFGYAAVNLPGHYFYVAHGDVFAPNVGARVVAGPQVALIGSHMTRYGGAGGVAVGARAGLAPVRGPAPAALGIRPENVPHVPPGDRNVAMARGFSRPSTATRLGGHPAAAKQVSRTAPRPTGGGGGGYRGGHAGGSHGHR
jgi:hypothetical protein